MDAATIATVIGVAVALGIPALGFAAAWGASRGELKALREQMQTHVRAIESKLAEMTDALKERDDDHDDLSKRMSQLERQVAVIADRVGVTPLSGIATTPVARARVTKPPGAR